MATLTLLCLCNFSGCFLQIALLQRSTATALYVNTFKKLKNNDTNQQYIKTKNSNQRQEYGNSSKHTKTQFRSKSWKFLKQFAKMGAISFSYSKKIFLVQIWLKIFVTLKKLRYVCTETQHKNITLALETFTIY